MKAMRSYYRDCKKSSSNLFRADFAVSLDCTDKNYDSFENTVIKTHNTRMKKKLSELMKYLMRLRQLGKQLQKV